MHCPERLRPHAGAGARTVPATSRRMHLIQILLPLYDDEGNPFPDAQLRAVRERLVERFGGVTAFVRAPAEGAWRDSDGDVARDDVVILETMADRLDHAWWSAYRRELEAEFRQDEIVVRAQEIERL
jgi:hypothetical protein